MKKLVLFTMVASLVSFSAFAREHLKDHQRARAHKHFVENPIPDYAWDNQVKEGVAIPEKGAVLYSFPSEYDMAAYRYTRVNGDYVVVDPSTREVVEVIK